jgi:drug/metabolite transporter (DMT)-like permease
MFPKLPKHHLAQYYTAILLAYFIWGGAGPVIKLTLEYIPPATFLFFRLLIVCLIILPQTILTLQRDSIHHKDLFKVFLLGIFSQTSLILIFIGFKYTSALEGTIIGILGTILSVYAGHFYYKEKIDWHVNLGLLIAVAGTLFITFEPLIRAGATLDSERRVFGNLMIVAYNLAFLLYIIWSKISMGQNTRNVKRTLKILHMKPMIKKYSPILLMSISFYVGLVSFIPMSLLEQAGYFGPVNFSITDVTLVPTMGILYMALLSSIIAYYAFEWGLTKIEIKESAIFSYLQPVFALPFAFVLLGELPNQYMIIGSIIIALGIIIAESKRS